MSDLQQVVMAVSVFLIAALLSLAFIPGFNPTAWFSQPTGRDLARGSQQSAVQACLMATQGIYGARLLQTNVDNRATRFNEQAETYQVFINVMLQGQERLDNYMVCEVSAAGQRVLSASLEGPGAELQLN